MNESLDYQNFDFFEKKFDSFCQLKEQLEQWSKMNYVPIKIRTSNRLKNEDPCSKTLIYSSIYYTCVHYGEYRPRVTTGSRVHQKVYSTNCPFMIHVKSDVKKGELYVFKYETKHNHEISEEIFCNYPKNRRLDKNKEKEVAKLLSVDPVHRKLKRQITMNTNKPITSYDIYNLKAKLLKKDDNFNSDEGTKIKNLIEKIKNEDIENKVAYSLDNDNQLQCLFIQTKFQANWFKNFDTIIHIDGIFKLNVENYLLYVILVQDSNCNGRPVSYCLMKNETNENLEFFYNKFSEYNSVEFVKLVMVDKDLSKLFLVKKFFPNSLTLLCVFHVIKYLKSVVGKLVVSQCVKNELMECMQGMVYVCNEEEYESYYNELKEKAKKSKDFLNYFDKNWHNCQDLCVRYYRQALPTLGTHTNNHLESYNNNLKISIKARSHLTDCIVELMLITKETCSSVRVNELISHLSDHASDLILNQYDLIKKSNYSIHRVGQKDFNIHSTNKNYLVRVDNNNLVKCECDFTINFLLPCRHTLFICEYNLNLTPWFHERFLKKASTKDINPLVESQNINSSNNRPIWQWTKDCLKPSTPEQKFRKLKNLVEDITNVICASGEEEFVLQQNKLKNFLGTLQTNKHRYETSVLDESTPKSSVKINNSKIDESPLSNISSYRRNLFKDLEISSEFSLDEDNTLVDQSDFVFSPEIKVNKVVNRVGRPKNSKKKLGFFNVNKHKRGLETKDLKDVQRTNDVLSPIGKRTRSQF
ncbi:unnamed protein product [Brachionus calyciflorus]|uniref:SWIM-type domain-containing protein n=1 Tax=Brachionus calyciflorus TaxID=104777 RepID=A0A814IPR4_9BILA|nr:unnamed protein product [Brachionus calyciflorus]